MNGTFSTRLVPTLNGSVENDRIRTGQTSARGSVSRMRSQTREEREVEQAARLNEQVGTLWPLVIPKAYESDVWLYDQLVEFARKNQDLEDDRYYELEASSIFHSYRVREYRTTPYLFYHGPPGTGKNRGMHILKALCYRGLMSGDPSAASIYQTLNYYHPTLLIDEGEKLAPYHKDQGDGVKALIAVLNSGYCQDQPIIRADGDGNVPHLYDPFGFKVIASTETLPQTVLERCIVINTETNVRQDIPVDFDPNQAADMKRYLETYALRHDPKVPLHVKEDRFDINSLKSEVANYRVIELFGPLIAKTPGKTARDHLVELARELAGDRAEEAGAGEDSQILAALYRIRQFDPQQAQYTVAAISKLFNGSRDDGATRSTDWLGRKLRKFGLKPCRIGPEKLRGICWDQKKFERRFVRYGLVGLPQQSGPSGPSGTFEKENGATSILDGYRPNESGTTSTTKTTSPEVANGVLRGRASPSPQGNRRRDVQGGICSGCPTGISCEGGDP